MSLDWDGKVTHPRASEGAMRSKCPWTAQRLSNSHNALMMQRTEEYRLKSEAEAETRVSASAYKPKDLELFQASAFQVKSCFKGYDKCTTAPDHGTLPAWDIKPETFALLRRGY